MHPLNQATPTHCPKFSSKIVLVSKKELSQIVPGIHHLSKRDEYSSSPWDVSTVVRLKEKGFTDGAINCTVLGLNNARQLALFHLWPKTYHSQSDRSPIRENLEQLLTALAAEGEKIQGLIAGGWAKDNPDSFSGEDVPDSYNLFHYLQEQLIDLGLDLSLVSRIRGRKKQKRGFDASSDVYYLAQQDTWYLRAGKRNSKDALLTEEALKAVFDDVYIAPGDELIDLYHPQRKALLEEAEKLKAKN